MKELKMDKKTKINTAALHALKYAKGSMELDINLGERGSEIAKKIKNLGGFLDNLAEEVNINEKDLFLLATLSPHIEIIEEIIPGDPKLLMYIFLGYRAFRYDPKNSLKININNKEFYNSFKESDVHNFLSILNDNSFDVKMDDKDLFFIAMMEQGIQKIYKKIKSKDNDK